MIDDITLERGLRAHPPADPVYRSRITATAPATSRPVTRQVRHQAPGMSRPMPTATRVFAAAAIIAVGSGALLMSVGHGPSPGATKAPSPSASPILALVTQTVEPGVERVVNDGIRDVVPLGVNFNADVSTTLAAGADGSVWVFEPGRLFRLGTGLAIQETHRFFHAADPEVAPDGTLWVAMRGLRRLDGSSWVQVRPSTPGGGNALAIQPDGTVWFAWARSGHAVVERLDGDVWTKLPPMPPSIVKNEDDLVHDQNLVVSPTGDVWVATSEGQLFHLAGDAWEKVDPFGGGVASRYRRWAVGARLEQRRYSPRAHDRRRLGDPRRGRRRA